MDEKLDYGKRDDLPEPAKSVPGGDFETKRPKSGQQKWVKETPRSKEKLRDAKEQKQKAQKQTKDQSKDQEQKVPPYIVQADTNSPWRKPKPWEKDYVKKLKEREDLVLGSFPAVPPSDHQIATEALNKEIEDLPKLNPPTIEEEAFAVVQVSGAQYKVMKGDLIMVHKLEGVPVGSEIVLPKILLVATKSWTAIGTPVLKARVHATVEEQARTAKAIIFKKKRRKNYRRYNTDRHPFTMMRIGDIKFDQNAYSQEQEQLAREEMAQKEEERERAFREALLNERAQPVLQ
eukprot:TRINITY_DN22226_c0_g1_i1.p1 TRINITY_DN22226_c0_g1~~TRINITY_DN22226_c0_g1_i1.p1  ORF type:complete len:340 (+),score=98.71 TRINITY_DN22226_c0_g1_i1:152-1021(+)